MAGPYQYTPQSGLAPLPSWYGRPQQPDVFGAMNQYAEHEKNMAAAKELERKEQFLQQMGQGMQGMDLDRDPSAIIGDYHKQALELGVNLGHLPGVEAGLQGMQGVQQRKQQQDFAEAMRVAMDTPGSGSDRINALAKLAVDYGDTEQAIKLIQKAESQRLKEQKAAQGGSDDSLKGVMRPEIWENPSTGENLTIRNKADFARIPDGWKRQMELTPTAAASELKRLGNELMLNRANLADNPKEEKRIRETMANLEKIVEQGINRGSGFSPPPPANPAPEVVQPQVTIPQTGSSLNEEAARAFAQKAMQAGLSKEQARAAWAAQGGGLE